jgi:hypothetical protein
MNFPRHDASLHLTHNQHKAYYMTVAEIDREQDYDWVSEEQKQKAIATGDYWELQWYPDTPTGSYSLCAADLDVLLAAACEYA